MKDSVSRCQSCGMPLNKEHSAYMAKEPDGSDSIYCSYCYKDGAFIYPKATLSDMIEMCVPTLAEQMGERAAREHLVGLLPTLARWSDK